jgi:hypothetical protein
MIEPYTATGLEVAWSVIAALGLLFTLWTVGDNVQNFRQIRRAIKLGRAVYGGPRWWIAVGSLGSSGITTAIWICMLLAGVIAMTVGPGSPESTRVWTGYAVSGFLVAAVVLMLVVQVWQLIARWKVRGAWRPVP